MPGWVKSLKIASSEYTARCWVIPIHIMFTAPFAAGGIRGRLIGGGFYLNSIGRLIVGSGNVA